MKRRSLLSAACVLLIFNAQFSNQATAADWTEFRGPGGQGIADVQGLPTTWSESENIAWKVAVPGVGWSSPVVSDNRIYLTTAVTEGVAKAAKTSLRVLCLQASDGSVVWNEEAFIHDESGVEMHQKNSHASPTPILEDGRLYVHFGSNGTACLQTDGQTVWKNQDLKYAPQHGNGGSPAVAGNILIICCDGKDKRFVSGLNKLTGEEVWRRDRELEPSRGFSFCTPTIITVEDQLQAVCPGSGGVWSYDPQTGEQLWRVAYGEGYSVVPRPVFGHGLVYVCSGFGDQQLFAIDPTGRGDITETHVKWTLRKGVPKSPSLLLVGTEMYMVDDKGVATCLDALTGELHWQQRLTGGFSASPTLADGLIYFQNETGVTTVVRPGTTYQEVAQNSLGDGKTRTFASFAFVDNAILLRSETDLYRIQNAAR